MIRSVILIVPPLVRCSVWCGPVVTDALVDWCYNSVHGDTAGSDGWVSTSTGSVCVPYSIVLCVREDCRMK